MFDDSAPDPAATDDTATGPVASVIRERHLDRYVGSFAAEWPEVQAVETPAEKDGWVPLPHEEFHGMVLEALRGEGIGVTEQIHSLYRRGDRYIGLGVTDLVSPAGGRDVFVGWFNSHDRSAAATLLLGEQVTVCFNLCLYGEVKVARRHTAHIRRDLPALIGDAVGRFTRAMVDQAKRCDAYREAPLLRSAGNDVLIRLLEEGVFPPSHIRKVLDEWTRPTIPQHAAAWNIDRLYQAVTFQQTPLWDMGRRHRSLHRVLDDVAGIAPAPRAPSRA
jgi:hypothetical protein